MVAMAIYSVTMVLWKKNRISSLQSHGKTLEKECCLPGVFCYYYYYYYYYYRPYAPGRKKVRCGELLVGVMKYSCLPSVLDVR